MALSGTFVREVSERANTPNLLLNRWFRMKAAPLAWVRLRGSPQAEIPANYLAVTDLALLPRWVRFAPAQRA
jgi:hypothetical protein